MIEQQQLSEVAPGVVSETFEGMAFLALSLSGAPDDAAALDWLWAEVAVHAPFAGAVRVACPRPLAEEMTRTMFGQINEAHLQQAIIDALREVTNTIAGKLVAGLSCDAELMKLGLPESGEGLPSDAMGQTFWFLTEELQPLRVEVRI